MIEKMRASIATTRKQVSYLDPLVRWAADPERATIATLNYDLAVEIAGSEVSVGAIPASRVGRLLADGSGLLQEFAS